MNHEEWSSCLDVKVLGTWNLHNAVRQRRLDFFVVFSSVSGACGNPGQANYAAANTFLNSLTQYRRQLGLSSSIVDLGAVEDVGMMACDPKVLGNARAASIRLLHEAELMEGLRVAICQSPAAAEHTSNMTSSPCVIGLGNSRPLSDPGVRTMWTRDLRFSHYHTFDSKDAGQGKVTNDELRALLRKVENNPKLLEDPESEAIVRRELIKQVRDRMPQTRDMDEDQIAELTIDSLMAIEIKTWVRSNLGLDISLAEVGKAGTAGALAKTAVEHLKAKYSAKESHGDGDHAGKATSS